LARRLSESAAFSLVSRIRSAEDLLGYRSRTGTNRPLFESRYLTASLAAPIASSFVRCIAPCSGDGMRSRLVVLGPSFISRADTGCPDFVFRPILRVGDRLMMGWNYMGDRRRTPRSSYQSLSANRGKGIPLPQCPLLPIAEATNLRGQYQSIRSRKKRGFPPTRATTTFRLSN